MAATLAKKLNLKNYIYIHIYQLEIEHEHEYPGKKKGKRAKKILVDMIL